MHAAYPAKQKGFGFDILKLENAEEFEVEHLELLVLDLHDALQDRRAVLRVRIHQSLGVAVKAFLEHLFLNLHNFLEDRVDVRLRMCHIVQKQIFLLDSTLEGTYSLDAWKSCGTAS